MRTEHVRELLPDFINGQVDGSAAQAIEEHLKSCSACRSEYEELQEVFAALENEKLAAPPPDYFSTFRARLRQRLEGTSRHRTSLWRPLLVRFALPVAAGVVGIALLLQIPLMTNGVQLSTTKGTSDLSQFSAQELLHAYVEHGRFQPVAPLPPQQTLEELIPNKAVGNSIAKELYGTSDIVSEGFKVVPAPQLIADLSEREVDVLLERLGERTIL